MLLWVISPWARQAMADRLCHAVPRPKKHFEPPNAKLDAVRGVQALIRASLEGLAWANREHSLGSNGSTARPAGPMRVPNPRVQPFLLGLSPAPPSADTPLRHLES